MMAQKHLHELLSEDQEPFQLHNYIADRRCQLNRAPTQKFTSSSLQTKKTRKPILETSSSRRNLCKKACFLSFQDSPDVRNSPFLSPAKAPSQSLNNAVFLHIPAKTASMLLEAAVKIQKQSSKPKPHVGFGLFGSILKRLKDKNKNKSHEISLNSAGVLVEGDPFEESENSTKKLENNFVGNYEIGFAKNGRPSSAGWSESNEDKSLNMGTSCSTSRSDFMEEIDFAPCEKHFCLSPLSPFHFALQRSPSVGRRTPDFSSPATSPIRHLTQEGDNQEAENLQKIKHEEEEQDQFSPVSVLDPPFEDDDDQYHGDEEDDEDSDYDIECSYAMVQRAKQQLLQKLRRFERLAELEPVELEKRMLEGFDVEDDDGELDAEEEYNEVDESGSLYAEENVDEFIGEVLSRSNVCRLNKIPGDMKRLVLDLIADEKKNGRENISDEVVVNMVRKRLDSWKEVECNTIDMMVEVDLRKEADGWKNYEEIEDRAKEIELAIFGFLVEELLVS